MKKFAITLAAISLIVLASCEGHKRCPAYDSLDAAGNLLKQSICTLK